MRIAVVCETFLPDVNGVAATLSRLLLHLQQLGHQVLLIAPEGAPLEYAGARIVTLPGFTFPLYPELRVTLPTAQLRRELRRFRPDLIHLVGPFVLGAAVPTIAHRMNVPVISSYHTDFADYSRHYGLGLCAPLVQAWLRMIHNRCQLTLVPSSWTIGRLREAGFRRLRLWARGVDCSRFTPETGTTTWRRMVAAAEHEAILLYVGRLAREKRIDLLISALHNIRNARLVIVGDGPARAELERLSQGLPVHFTGYLHGTALAQAYAGSDLFVFPSDTDTFGQVLQEALASGLPVAAAQAGGAIDLIRDGVNGRLFRPGDVNDLRRTVAELIADRAALKQLGHNGRQFAENRSWPLVLDQLISQYQLIVSRHRHRMRTQMARLRRSILAEGTGS